MSLSQTTHMPMLDYSTDKSNDRYWGLTLSTWVQIVSVTVLMCALFRFNLARLWGKTNPFNGQDSNWQHSVFVPVIGIWYLFLHREELVAAAGKAAKRENAIRVLSLLGLGLMVVAGLMLLSRGETGFWLLLVGVLGAGMAIPAVAPTATLFGSALLIEGLIVFAFGIYPGQNDYMKDLGMVITLFGVVTLLTGWSVMKVAWFPIVFLVVALPWPELVYSELAWPLQKLAASAAVGTLRIFNVDAQNFGTRIFMRGEGGEARMLNVAEACAGLKSVMTFLMVAGTVAFLNNRPLWEKGVIAFSAIPIAIFCNVVRVTGQGLLDFYWSHEVSEGFAHSFIGLIMVIPGFFLIMLVGLVLEKLFIEEVDRSKLARAGAGRSKRIIVEIPKRTDAVELATSETVAAPISETSASISSPPVHVVQTPAAVAQLKSAPAQQLASAPHPEHPIAPTPPARMIAPVAVASTPVRSAPATPPAPVSQPGVRPTAQKAATAPSTLKPSSKDRPLAISPTPPPSTLKPSSRPPAARAPGPTLPPAALKPSTLKPSTPKSIAPGSMPASPLGARPPVRSPSLAPPPRKPPPASQSSLNPPESSGKSK